MFRSFCGKAGIQHVIFTTSKWSCINGEEGGRHKTQLKDGFKFLGGMIMQGAKTRRFDGTGFST